MLRLHPNASLIKGVVCGIRVEDIDDPLMKNIRYLDKLIDELAKGKSMDKILPGLTSTHQPSRPVTRPSPPPPRTGAGSCVVLLVARQGSKRCQPQGAPGAMFQWKWLPCLGSLRMTSVARRPSSSTTPRIAS